MGPDTAYIMTHLLQGGGQRRDRVAPEGPGPPGGRQNGHHQRFPGCLVPRFCPPGYRRRLGRHRQPYPAGARRNRSPGGQPDFSGISAEGPGEPPRGRFSGAAGHRLPAGEGAGAARRIGSLQRSEGNPRLPDANPYSVSPYKETPIGNSNYETKENSRRQQKLIIRLSIWISLQLSGVRYSLRSHEVYGGFEIRCSMLAVRCS